MTPQEVADRLGARHTGDGRWQARCPAHDDNDPSLSIGTGADGQTLLHCHAGCDLPAVTQALGVRLADLFREPIETESRQIVARYPYQDSNGTLLYEVVRYTPKDFRQRRPDGNGGWVWNLEGVTRVLYRLPYVARYVDAGESHVWVTEGEKDAETLTALGEYATTFVGGAGKHHKTPGGLELLAKATRVTVVADNDEPGHRHARAVAADINTLGGNATVVVPAIGKDITDAAVTHGLPIDQAVTELVDQLPESGNPYLQQHVDWGEFWTKDHDAEDEWLLEPLLVRGRGHSLSAPAKTGKSLLFLAVAAAVATGTGFMHQPGGDPQPVLYIDAEMTERDLYERLRTIGYGPGTDFTHLHYRLGGNAPRLDSDEGGRQLVDAAKALNAVLVVEDTIARLVNGDENDMETYRDYDRYTGRPLKDAGIAHIRLDHAGHTNKDRARGSSAKNDDVDVIWSLKGTDDGFELKSTARVAYAHGQVVNITKEEDGELLRFRVAPKGWPAGTKDCAALLDRLGVPLDASRADAQAVIRSADGKGRKNEVVSAALKFRRESVAERLVSAGDSSGDSFLGRLGQPLGTEGESLV